MKFRRIITVVLVLCLVMSLCVSVYAEPDDSDNTSIPKTTEAPIPDASPEPDNSDNSDNSDVPGTAVTVPPVVPEDPEDSGISQIPADPDDFLVTEEPEVNMDDAELAATAAEEDVINVAVPPTGRIIINPYSLDVDLGTYIDTAQIVHEPQIFYNFSEFPVTVGIKVRGIVSQGSRAVFVPRTPTEQTREVFLYVEFRDSDTGWESAYSGADNQVVATANGELSSNVLEIDAGGRGYFRVSGVMSPHVSWEYTDTFGAVLTYTFSAAPEPEPGPVDG